MNLTLAAALACGSAACAGMGGDRGVSAVVNDEQARQAAAASARHGETPDTALKAGAQAAATETSPADPPT